MKAQEKMRNSCRSAEKGSPYSYTHRKKFPGMSMCGAAWSALILLSSVFHGACAQDILDTSFVPPTDTYWTDGVRISAAALQPDGKVIIGGYLKQRGPGLPVFSLRRLDRDGALDDAFLPIGTSPGNAGGDATVLIVQPDGKVLVSGSFTNLNGDSSVNRVARFNSDGSLDATFSAHFSVNGTQVSGMAMQTDGKILVAGDFTAVNGAAANALARLNPDGTLDSGFTSPLSSAQAPTVILRADGKVLLGGSGLSYAGSGGMPTRASLLRLKANGSLDADLSGAVNFPDFIDTYALAAAPDGSVLVSGMTPDGWTIRKVRTDDSADGRFANLVYGEVSGFQCGCINSIFVQPNGRIIAGGTFNTVGGATHFNVVRLNADGTIDPTFDPSGNGAMGDFVLFSQYASFKALAAQVDGRILVTGSFTKIGSAQVPRYGIARLLVPEVAIDQLRYDAGPGIVQWQRAGSGTEFQRVTFESSNDGQSWAALGEGAWSAGAWSFNAVDLAADGPLWLRARGFTGGGGSLASGGSVLESVLQLVATVTPSVGPGGSIAPAIPQFVTAGSTTAFSLVPNAGQQILGVGGNCGGTLNASTFTILPVRADCTVEASFTAASDYIVTPTATAGGTLSPSAPQVVAPGQAATFTVAVAPHYSLSGVSGCGGSLSGDTFTTAPITGSCTISAVFAIDVLHIAANVGAGGSVTPLLPQSVGYGDTLSFTVAPDAYHRAAVSSSCGGSFDFDGTRYTTNPITADCTLDVAFPSMQFVVTPALAPNGQVTPSTPQLIDGGTSAVFTVAPNAGYAAAVTGTCGGHLVGTIYTTDPVTADCSVTVVFLPVTYTVTPDADAHGSITPNVPQSAAFGDVLSFVVTPEAGYAARVDGTCGGSLSGKVFVTEQIGADCTVHAHFSDEIFVNGFEAVVQ